MFCILSTRIDVKICCFVCNLLVSLQSMANACGASTVMSVFLAISFQCPRINVPCLISHVV
jgi:hypothetical protein